MRTPKIVGRQKPPRTPTEFHPLGARLDREAQVIGPPRARGFVFKARTWEEFERWDNERRTRHARRKRAQ
jgi:hypothetical protein